ncbi:MAG: hypothetical protein PHS57_04145 [Alphaproteobacteria bacterium]|nr:hypothetical protein [Alphaproteobacteria bacterium]
MRFVLLPFSPRKDIPEVNAPHKKQKFSRDDLVTQSRACAQRLWLKDLGQEPMEERDVQITELARIVKGHICDRVLFRPKGLGLSEETVPPRSIYLLDSLETCFLSNGNIAVLDGTFIALPFNKRRKIFYINKAFLSSSPSGLSSEWRWYVSSPKKTSFYLKPPPPSQKNGYQYPRIPLCEKTLALSAEEALFDDVRPEVAAWWLERQTGGRQTIYFNPPEENVASLYRKETNKKAIRQKAIRQTLDEWGDAIDPCLILKYFDEVSPFMEVHHKYPISWGGTNATCVLVDKKFHDYVHREINWTQLRLDKLLGVNMFFLDNPDSIRSILDEKPELIDELQKIRHVSVSDNHGIGLDVLWPKASCYHAGLERFKAQYNGHHGPNDQARTALSCCQERLPQLSL